MPSVSVPSSFFVSERNSVYGNWRTAFWRELLSNALDAGAERIRIRTRFEEDRLLVDVIDNGCGMSREVVETVYMRLGASTKTGDDGIGGFGRARILTCFSQDGYRIRSGDFVVTGKGASYDIQQAPKSVKGCAISVRMPAAEARGIYAGLSTVLRQSSLRSIIDVKLDMDAPQDVYLPDIDSSNFSEADADGWRRFRAWSRQGRHFDTLLDETGSWAQLHVNDGARALKHMVVVRVNGMAMYDDHIQAPTQVTINLEPGRAREILTASRDAIRAPFRDILQDLYQKISSERLSAFRGRPQVPITEMRVTERTIGGTGHLMPKPAALNGRPARIDPVSAPGLAHVSVDALAGIAQQSIEERSEMPYGLLYPVALHINDPTPAQRAASARYTGESWLKPGNEGRNAELLHAAWTAACRHSLAALATAEPGLQWGSAERWVTGFVLDRDMRACHCAVCDIPHGLLLNPVDEAGRMRFKLSDPQSMKVLIATAIHEVCHVVSRRHDEIFAATMTGLVAAIRDRDIEKDIRGEIDIMREWQNARQACFEAHREAAVVPVADQAEHLSTPQL